MTTLNLNKKISPIKIRNLNSRRESIDSLFQEAIKEYKEGKTVNVWDLL